jgi:hypothetical protein
MSKWGFNKEGLKKVLDIDSYGLTQDRRHIITLENKMKTKKKIQKSCWMKRKRSEAKAPRGKGRYWGKGSR